MVNDSLSSLGFASFIKTGSVLSKQNSDLVKMGAESNLSLEINFKSCFQDCVRFGKEVTKRLKKQIAVCYPFEFKSFNFFMYRVASDTELAGYPAAGYPANSFAGYPANSFAGYPARFQLDTGYPPKNIF